MKAFDFCRRSPESHGISSADVLRFLKHLDGLGLYTHSILISRGSELICEAYYHPFTKDTLHRQYSVSKSFVSAAVGVAVTEGLFSLDDVIADYFPEYFGEENADALYRRCRIRDMLTMSSNIGTNVYWWGKFKTRIEAYYSQQSVKAPGEVYYYDSIGSFLLGAIIQKLTGKDFLQYLKEKVLSELGFSEESYVLCEPGGYAVGDSAVMCTLRDLWILARLYAQGGEVNGKRYIDAQYVHDATSYRVTNDLYADVNPLINSGYGYLTWITPVGFAFVGAGDQLALYDKKHDVTVVLHSDNQGADASCALIYQAFETLLLPSFDGGACVEQETAQAELRAYEDSRRLRCQYGDASAVIKARIDGVQYEAAMKNPVGIERFCVRFDREGGRIDFVRHGKEYGFAFGFGRNRAVKFSFGERARADMMGVWERGEYDCVASAGFVDARTLSVLLQVTDTYFGKLHIVIGFGDGEASMHITKRGQYVFDGIEGYIFAKAIKE